MPPTMPAIHEQKERVSEFYEKHHSRGKYDYLYGGEDRKRALVELIGKGNKVLDIGCRSGNLTQHYCEGNEVTGVDIDRKALELFRDRLGLPGHWVDVDAEPLPFSDASFDVVVMTEVMEHLRFPKQVLQEIRRVLRPGGRFVGSVPNAFRLRNRLKFMVGKPFESDPSHLRSYSTRLLRKELEGFFSEVRIVPVSGHLLGGGRFGVPVYPWLPNGLRTLFALDLVWESEKR
ncbi:MAG: class I SAM-dependent methyltransferase [Verrucomicrobia bacterium]|nr:class I SAM-dependent methyltransferase [Verrucomicrobiota bacterium]